MNKTRLGFLLPLLAFPCLASAASPNGAWLEFHSGKLWADESPADAISDTGNARGFAGSLPIGAKAYIRGDWREETFEWQSTTTAAMETNRTVSALTVGMVEVGHPEYRMFGEIGAAQIEWEHSVAGETEPGIKEISPMLRIGLAGEDGRFSWYLSGDWVTKALQPDGSEARERWWNVYLGYQLTQRLELGVRYADNDLFSNTGASLRIRF